MAFRIFSIIAIFMFVAFIGSREVKLFSDQNEIEDFLWHYINADEPGNINITDSKKSPIFFVSSNDIKYSILDVLRSVNNKILDGKYIKKDELEIREFSVRSVKAINLYLNKNMIKPPANLPGNLRLGSDSSGIVTFASYQSNNICGQQYWNNALRTRIQRLLYLIEFNSKTNEFLKLKDYLENILNKIPIGPVIPER